MKKIFIFYRWVHAYYKKYISNLKQNRKLTITDISIFFRQFATLISAGVPIIQSCDILEQSQEKMALRILIYSIKREVLTGKSCFTSLQKYPHYFDELTCHLIEIGEHTGKLDTMLVTVAAYWEKNLSIQKRIKQALFYPCMISIMALLVTGGLFIFIIPKFAELFQDSQVKLPLLTRWLFYLSYQAQQYGWIVVAAFLFSLVLCSHRKIASRLKSHLRLFVIGLPIVRAYLHKIRLARFARNLAITFTSGIPINDGLKLSVPANDNFEFVTIVAKLRSKISSGRQLHHAMESFSYFPILMVQMIKIGEESGMLEHMLNKMADFLESDIEQLLSRLSQLLEPLIMVLLGVLIGGIVIGMYLPIFKLGSTL